jgi:hypothetical protein
MEWLPGDLSGYLYSVLFAGDNAVFLSDSVAAQIFLAHRDIFSSAIRTWAMSEIS